MDRTKLIVLLAVLLTMALCLTIFIATQAKKIGTEPESTTQGTTQSQPQNENPIETIKTGCYGRTGLVVCVAGILLLGLASCVYGYLSGLSLTVGF